jgi:hypothetical protein
MEKKKFLAPTGIRTRTVHPVASRCTGPQTGKRSAVKIVIQLHKFFDFAVPSKDSIHIHVKRNVTYGKYVSF